MNIDAYMMINKWIIEIIVCLWNGYFAVSLLSKQYMLNKKGSKAPLTPKPILYSAIAAFLGFPICYTIKLIVYMIDPEPTDSITTLNLSVVWFSFAVSRLSYYMFMLARLYYSFRFSSFGINKRMLYCHIAILVITPIYIAVMIVLEGIGVTPGYYLWGSVACIAGLAIGSLHIMYTFNQKLYEVIVTTQLNNKEPSLQTNSSSTAQSLNFKDTKTGSHKLTRKMFVVIVKNTLLTCITNAMFLMFVILYAVFSFIELNTAQWTVLAYFQVITINAASLCIYLSFGINKKLYAKCCGKPQKKCESFFEKFMQKKDVVEKIEINTAPHSQRQSVVSVQSGTKTLTAGPSTPLSQ